MATLDIRAFNDEMVELFSQLELAFNQFHFGLQSTNPKALELAKKLAAGTAMLPGLTISAGDRIVVNQAPGAQENHNRQ